MTCPNERYKEHFKKTGEFLSARTKHGSQSAYSNYGCRCELCTKASGVANKKTYAKLRQKFSDTGEFAANAKHGSKYAYQLGCRCQICVDSYSKFQLQRRLKNGRKKS